MSWYPQPSNSTIGLNGLGNALNTGLSGIPGMQIIGANFVAISMLAPVWFIMFLALSRFNASAAWIISSFICMIVSLFLIAIGWANAILFAAFFLMTFGGLIGYYLQTRG